MRRLPTTPTLALTALTASCYGQLPLEGAGGSGGSDGGTRGVTSSSSDSSTTSASGGRPVDVLGEVERVMLFGDDRVADAFVAVWPDLPGSLEEVELLFGVGRACERPTSREVFTLEEPQTRRNGENVATIDWVPRFVMSGCSDTVAERAELFVVAVADPELPEVDDPLARTHVELMARDRGTATFNFYDLSFEPGGGTTIRRTVREDDEVLERSRTVGAPLIEQVASSNHCFACHVQGAPLMLELSNPWTGWISEVSPQTRRSYAGATQSLVEESVVGLDGRGSRAYDLQGTVERAMERLVAEGLGPAAGDALDRSMIRALLCETELNFEPRPIALFVDPEVLDGTAASVTIPAMLELPRLLPVRSRIDRQIERWLVAEGALRQSTALALRVFDDEHDVFSTRRCALASELPDEVSTSTLEPALRGLLSSRLDETSTPTAAAYVAALIEVPTPPQLAEVRLAYLDSVVERLEAAALALEGEAGRQALEERAAGRVAAARAMFPGVSAPLPWFEMEPTATR